jgi:hypothetical protein
MSKLLTIENCAECKHCVHIPYKGSGIFFECHEDSIGVKRVLGIKLPSWCPLPDADKQEG